MSYKLVLVCLWGFFAVFFFGFFLLLFFRSTLSKTWSDEEMKPVNLRINKYVLALYTRFLSADRRSYLVWRHAISWNLFIGTPQNRLASFVCILIDFFSVENSWCWKNCTVCNEIRNFNGHSNFSDFRFLNYYITSDFDQIYT